MYVYAIFVLTSLVVLLPFSPLHVTTDVVSRLMIHSTGRTRLRSQQTWYFFHRMRPTKLSPRYRAHVYTSSNQASLLYHSCRLYEKESVCANAPLFPNTSQRNAKRRARNTFALFLSSSHRTTHSAFTPACTPYIHRRSTLRERESE